ncbi:MAG: hypothetical protein WED04_04960 [Promethearchaeati archaeon SRVP18_Atabeyarchaeia-1]
MDTNPLVSSERKEYLLNTTSFGSKESYFKWVDRNMGMQYSRLGVVLGTIGILVYFWTLGALVDLWGIGSVLGSSIFYWPTRLFVAPLFFSIPWVLFIYLNKDRLADAIQHMSETTTIIPVRYRTFYGFNTLIILVFFALPFFSPVLAVIGGAVLVGRIYYGRDYIRSGGRRRKILFIILLSAVFIGVPGILLIRIITPYIDALGLIWSSWEINVPIIYVFSLCLGDALAVGSLIWFIYAGAAEFEFQKYGMYSTRAPAKLIWLFEAAIFLVFVYLGVLLYLPIPQIGWTPAGGDLTHSLLMNYINPVCLAIVAIIFLLSTFRGLRRSGERSSPWGFIFLIGFFAIDFVFRFTNALNIASVLTIVLFAASALFLVILVISFRRVGRR